MLTAEQKRQYTEHGFLTLPGLLDLSEIETLRAETHRIFTENRAEVIRTDEGAPRVALAMHWYSEIFRDLLKNPKLMDPVKDLLNEPFYCHQYKIVTKNPFSKQGLPWHQDYGTWRETDGMPEPDALTIGLFLEDVSEFNGSLAFVPGSHKNSTIFDTQDEFFPGKKIKSVTLSPEVLTPMIEKNGIVSPKGPAGTAVLFHSCVVHGSGVNMTGGWRHIVYISPNPVRNHLTDPKRDEMFALRDFAPM
jgi:ectoine hydroxylase